MRLRISWTYKNKYIETLLPLKSITGPHGTFQYYPVVCVDYKMLSESDIHVLSAQLGYESVEELFKFYKNDFNGII